MKPGIPQGAMMDATGAKPGDLERAQSHLLAAMLPQPGGSGRHAPITLAPLVRAVSQGSGAAAAMGRQASLALHATAALPALMANPAAWTQALSIASAVAQQWQGLQAQWIQGWTELAKDAGEWRQPNTFTKLIGQESDLIGRGLALVAAQATSTISAQEDIFVGVAWWMSRQGGTA